MEEQDWAEEEFGGVELGDKRRTDRLVRLARGRGKDPHGSIAESCGGEGEAEGAYRFYDNEEITLEKVLEGHKRATLKRVKGRKVVLAIQDTTYVNLTSHKNTQGVGYLQDMDHTGYLLHSTLLVTPKREPLGILQEQIWTRPADEFGKREKRHELATRDKESQKWLTSLQAVAEAQKEVPETLLVGVGDSEADEYALFAEGERLDQALLVRCGRDRLIENEEERHLWKHVKGQAEITKLEVAVSRQEGRMPRQAMASVRMAEVDLKVPAREKKREEIQTVKAWAILVREEAPPEGEERIEWCLLTNVATETVEQAIERVGWYSCRWVIEMLHHVLKSGCRIEERQFDDMENIKRYLAVDSIVAWRVLFLVLLGRENPNLPCDLILELHEWQALYCFVHKTTQPPDTPPTLGEVVLWIARLGGFTASKKHAPGSLVIWRGLTRLDAISQAWLVFHPST